MIRQIRTVDPRGGFGTHGVAQRPEHVAPGHHFAEIRLHAAELQGAGTLQGFLQQGGDEVELHRQAHAGLQRVHSRKAAFHRPAAAAVEIAVDQHVFPRDQHVIHYQNGVVLVKAAGERVVVRGAGCACHHLVGGAGDQLHALGVHRRDEHQREVWVFAHHLRGAEADHVVVGQGGVGGHHFRAADDNPGVGLFLQLDVDVFHLVRRLVAVDRRVNDGVVEVQAGFLNAGVPVPGVLLELAVEGRVGAQRAAERGFVVRRAAHPAVAQARPLGDGVALLAQVVGAFRHAEELVGIAAAAGVGAPAQRVLHVRLVQRVVHLRDGGRRIAKRRMGGDVFDALAVDVNLTPVLQAF